jgi:hypothetical protein
MYTLFVWLINHQPAVLFSQNKPAISNQPAVLFSQNKSAPAISHQPNEQAGSCWTRVMTNVEINVEFDRHVICTSHEYSFNPEMF